MKVRERIEELIREAMGKEIDTEVAKVSVIVKTFKWKIEKLEIDVEPCNFTPECIAHVEFSAEPYERGYVEELLMIIYVDSDKIKSALDEIKEWLEERLSDVEEGVAPLLFDGVSALNDTLELLMNIKEPYNTTGIDVKTLYDSGGDYPEITLVYDYLA